MVALLGAGCLAATACGGVPSLTIQGPANGSHVGGNVVRLSVAASNVTLQTPSAGGTNAHFVIYVDNPPVPVGEPVTPGANVVSSPSTRIPIAGLLVGRHTFTAILADGTNTRVNAPATQVAVTVDGPSVVADLEGATAAGKPFNVTLSSYGVTINDIPSDTSGRTAHYNVLIDRGMPQAGVIPTPGTGLIDTTGSLVQITPLSAGTHDLWVVLVNGAGRTLSPLSAAEVRVSLR